MCFLYAPHRLAGNTESIVGVEETKTLCKQEERPENGEDGVDGPHQEPAGEDIGKAYGFTRHPPMRPRLSRQRTVNRIAETVELEQDDEYLAEEEGGRHEDSYLNEPLSIAQASSATLSRVEVRPVDPQNRPAERPHLPHHRLRHPARKNGAV